MDWGPSGCGANSTARASTAQNGRPHDVSDHAFGAEPDGDLFDPNRWRKKWPQRAFFANAANPGWVLVCNPADSAQPHFDSAPTFEGLRLSGLRTEQILHRNCVRCRRGHYGRNRMDGV